MKSAKKEKTIIKICLVSLTVLLISILFWLLSRSFIPSNEDFSIFMPECSSDITVILDAGHGGGDSGANVGDILEKDVNLQIVTKIKAFLELYDCNVILTRTSDSLLASDSSKNKKREDLLNRVKVAKEYPDSLFVSIHMNKFPESKYNGLQVFYSPNALYSEALALTVQSNNKRYLEANNNRNVKKANSSIYVLDRIVSPAILIECGFLSNEEDRKKLTDESYQKKLAFVIANSIVEYHRL